MKRFAVHAVWILAMVLALSACASHDELSTEQPAGTVPGEKVSGEGVTPGVNPSGASANVKW